MALPKDCMLVGVELLDDAVDLPSFRHPLKTAYVFGPERGTLSPQMLARCSQTVKIPASFCINIAMAGAIVMYDRTVSLGRFAGRPLLPGARPEELTPHVRGGPKQRRKSPDR